MRPGGQYSTRITQDFFRGIRRLPNSDPFCKILLYDYETGRHPLQENHNEGLRRHFVHYLANSMSVFVIGYASRAGDDQENMGLSHLRATAVVNRISFLSNFSGSINVIPLGETNSASGGEDNMNRRAVLVLGYRHGPMPDYPPVRRHSLRATATRFKIRLLDGVEAGELIVLGAYRFEIDFDDRVAGAPASMRCEYAFQGTGGGGGAPIGVQRGGAWNYFSTHRLATPSDFSGTARMASIGISTPLGGVGQTAFTLMPNENNTVTIQPFQSGEAISAGGSVIGGRFVAMRLTDL